MTGEEAGPAPAPSTAPATAPASAPAPKYSARASASYKNPEVMRFDYIDKLFDPRFTDLFSEVTAEQRNVIAFFRSLHEKFKIPVLDNGKPVPLKDSTGKPVLDNNGKPIYAYRGGLPGVMTLCENFLRLNVSFGRQGRKEFVKILEPKAQVSANPFSVYPGGEEKKAGLLGGLFGGGKK